MCKKKSQDLSVSLGIQFSNAITSLNSDSIIRKAKAFVNTNSENFSNQIKLITNKNPTKLDDIRFSKNGGAVINLSNDNVLQNRIASSTKSKYDVIREYLIESFVGETLTLSDGIEAIMDKSDAKHLAHLSDNKKTATLLKLREVIEEAQLFSVANNVDHKKFDAFKYYKVRDSFKDAEFDILLNVGHSKFKDEYHIYDITKKGSVANESSTRLARSVDYALKNNTSTDIIHNSEEKVNTNRNCY